jgi:hypothetical protein
MIKLDKIYSEHFPLNGFTALTIFPYIFVRIDKIWNFTAKAERHETTHALQQIECLILGAIIAVFMLIAGYGWWSLIPLGLFFELYAVEWLVKLPFCKFNGTRAYISISTEQEAYEHQDEFGYNNVRRHFAWMRFIFKLKP